MLEALNPEQRGLDVVETDHLAKFVRDYRNKPPTFLPPTGVSYEFFALTRLMERTQSKPKLNKLPYKGLVAFKEEDADIFFGREAVVTDLLARLANQRFVAVLGASGSGKSSLVQAGLVPKLRHIHGKTWQVVQMRPSRDPLLTLAHKLVGVLPQIDLTGIDYDAAILSNTLTEVAGDNRVLLVIDQFEEVFTACEKAQREAFFACLMETVQMDNPLSVVITLRADFLAKCTEQDYHGLVQQIKNGVLLTPLNEQELEDVITLPLTNTDKSIEPKLKYLLINESLPEKGSLPLLQYALEKLWNMAVEQKLPQLTVKMYMELSRTNEGHSGLRGLLNQQITKFHKKLGVQQQNLMQWLFLELVQLGEGAEDTRKTVLEDELLQQHPQHAEQIKALLTQLKGREGGERLLTGDANLDNQATVTIAHETLIRAWGKLETWLAEFRKLKRWRERLKGDLNDWSSSQKSQDLLPSGRLVEAEEKLQKYQDSLLISEKEREYIIASKVFHEQAAKEKQAQINEVFINQASLLVYLAREQLNANKPASTIRLALEALDNPSKIQPERLPVENIGLYDILFNAINRHYQGVLQHDQIVKGAHVSPNGETLLTYTDNRVYLWNMHTRELCNFLEKREEKIVLTKFSPNGDYIVTVEGNSVFLWNAYNGQFKEMLKHDIAVDIVIFSPDSQRIITASKDETDETDENRIWLWNARDGQRLMSLDEQRLMSLEGRTTRITSVTFSPNGSYIAAAYWDSTVQLWETDNGKLFTTLPKCSDKEHSGEIKTSLVRFSPDSKQIIRNFNDKENKEYIAQRWNILKKEDKEYIAQRWNIFKKKGKEYIAQRWDIFKKEFFDNLEFDGFIHFIEFSNDGEYIALASRDAFAVKLWSKKSNQPIKVIKHSERITSIAFSPDNKYIIIASGKIVELWAVEDKLVTTLEHESEIKSAAFSPDGQCIVTVTNSIVHLWDFNKHEKLTALLPKNNNVDENLDEHSLIDKKSIKENIVSLWSADEQIKSQYDIDMFANLFRKKVNTVHQLDAKLQKNQTLAASTRDFNRVIVITANSLQEEEELHERDDNETQSTSIQGDATIVSWDTSQQKETSKKIEHSGNFNSVMFNLCDSCVLTAIDTDKFVFLWDAYEGYWLTTLCGHKRNISSAVFTSDGKHILVNFEGENCLPQIWLTFSSFNDMVVYAKKLLPPRDTNETTKKQLEGYRLTQREKQQFLSKERKDCSN